MWGSLADRKGRKPCCCAPVGDGDCVLLQGFRHQRLAAVYPAGDHGGLTPLYSQRHGAGGSQVPRERSGWALSTLSTAQISGVIGGPLLLGGFLADHVGLRMVFYYGDPADHQFSGDPVSD